MHKEHNDGEPVARSKDRTYSFGLEHSYAFSEQTKLIAGLSFDRREAIQAQNYQSDINGLYDYDVANKNALNYQLKLVHSFSQNDELSLSFARKTRFPTMKDRYSRSVSKHKIPNPLLKAEQADHYEISYFRLIADKVRLETALFYSQVRDAIEEVAINAQESMNQNVGKESYKSVELGVTGFVNDHLTLGLNYSYMRAKNHQTGMSVREVPKHKIFAYMDWKITPDFALYLSQSAETGRYSINGKDEVKLAGFGVTDVKLSYQLTPNLQVDAGVSNLFDKNYAYSEGYFEQGRTYFANLKYQF